MGFQRREISLPAPKPTSKSAVPTPLAVHWFPLRVCNSKCASCRHSTTTADPILPLDDAKRALRLLADAGMKTLRVGGGDPFLHPHYLGEVLKFCKEELSLASCAVVGSKTTERWLDAYGAHLDLLTIPCNSFDAAQPNIELRSTAKGDGTEVARWARERGIEVQVDTVVSINNWEEDMNDHIREIHPRRWKVSQASLLDLENAGRKSRSLRNTHHLKITKEQYQAFLDRHKAQTSLVSDEIEEPYLSVDERMRILNRRDGGNNPGRSILEVGVETALVDSGCDGKTFPNRAGLSERTRAPEPQSLDW